eukprot:COSAG03_NODE_16987_length_387_cov_0.534722_1_plen_79_part_00
MTLQTTGRRSVVMVHKMSVGKCCVRWGVGAAPETVRTGPLTEEELASLGLKFTYDSQYTCDACVTRRNRSKAREREVA